MEQVEWLSAEEALKLLQGKHGGKVTTKLLLADMLRDGEIRSRAGLMWESDAPNAAWKVQEGAEADVPIARSRWRASARWTKDQNEWRWPKSNFVITMQKKPVRRTIIRGIKFAAEDVLALATTGKSPGSRAGIGGRPPHLARWIDLSEALIQLAN